MGEHILPEGITYEAWPPREKGGQHVGGIYRVKVTHIPTGLVAIVNVGRSQHRNRRIAEDMILAGLTHPDNRP